MGRKGKSFQKPQFKQFPKLPFEIHIQVWRLAAFPRILDVGVKRVTYDGCKSDDIGWLWPRCKVPAVLHVCRESRLHASYERAFESGTDPRYTWVNFDLDIISINWWDIEAISPHNGQIQRLRIIENDEDAYDDFSYHSDEKMAGFTRLGEVFVVTRHSMLVWATTLESWPIHCVRPEEKVTFVDSWSGLMLRGTELEMVDAFQCYHAWDKDINKYGNVYDIIDIDKEIEVERCSPQLRLCDLQNR